MAGETGFPGGVNLRGSQPLLTAGKAASQVLRIAADVVAEETVTIGTNVYRVAVAGTDSTKDCSGLAVTGPANNPRATIPMLAHGLVPNDVILIDSELMLVLARDNANQITVQRGAFGTSVATHADGNAILTEAAPGAGGIPVGMGATLTPTVFTPRLVWAINNLGTMRAKAFQISVNFMAVAATDKPAKDGGVPVAGASALATTETLDGALNAWEAATMTGGRNPAMMDVISLVPTALQVTAGNIVLVFPYVPSVEAVKVQTTSTQAFVAWDGAATVTGNVLVLDNAGSVDWATTSTITLFVKPTN